jgi:hypothetical protein
MHLVADRIDQPAGLQQIDDLQIVSGRGVVIGDAVVVQYQHHAGAMLSGHLE